MPVAVRVIGCGRWLMGDDQAGLIAAEQLLHRRLPDCDVVCCETPGTSLADESLGGVERLVIIDAALADERHHAGTVHHFDYRTHPTRLRATASTSTHGLGVVEGLELAELLGVLPKHVSVFVILGKHFERCAELSADVASGMAALVDRIERDVRTWLRTSSDR